MRRTLVVSALFFVAGAFGCSDAGSSGTGETAGTGVMSEAGGTKAQLGGGGTGSGGVSNGGRSDSTGGAQNVGGARGGEDGIGGAGVGMSGSPAMGGASGGGAANAGGGTATNGEGGANLGGAGTAGGAGNAGSGGATHVGMWRVMPLGDSITGTTCYPKLLSQEISAKSQTKFQFVGTVLNNQSCGSAPNVQTEGHGGFLITASSTLSAMPGWFSADRPDIVLMHFGTNDVWNNVAPSTILNAYSTAVDDVRAVNGKAIFFVAQIIPMHPAGCDACEGRVETLDGQIPAWAASKATASSPIYVVDAHSVFDAASYTPNSSYTADGVHPNPSGSQKIADRWFAALSAHGLF